MVTGGVYNVVLVGEAVIFVALVHRVAVLGASRRDNGNSEGVLGGQDLFGHGRIAVLAVQGLDAVLVMRGLGSDDTLIPDMTSTTIGVGHGMGSIALAVHQHSARLGAGSLFQAFGVLEVPVVAADSGHRNENFAVAAIIGAVHPTLALSLARGLLDDFTETRVLMDMDLGNALGLGLVADGAGIGLDARLGGGRLLGDNALVPLMLLIDGDIADMLLIVAALTDLIYTASVLAGGGSSDFLVLMTQRRDDVVLEGLGGIFHALVHGIAVLSAGRSDHGLVVGVTQSRNALGVGITAVVAGEGLDTVLGVGGLGGHNAVIVIVTGCGDDLGVGMALVVLASEGLDAILGTGSSLGDNAVIVVMTQRGNLLGLSLGAAIVQALVGLHTGSLTGSRRGDSTIVPLVTHSRDDLSLGRAITRAGKGLLAILSAGSNLGDDTLAPIMVQSVHEIAVLGQRSVLVADVDGVALLSAGGSNRITLVPSLLHHRDILGIGITAGRAGKGLDALLVDGRFLGHDTLIIGVRGLVGEIALVSKTRNLIALIDGIALRSAGRSNDL